MKAKGALFVISIFISASLFAQAVSLDVNLDKIKEQSFPSLYTTCENHLHFISKYPIDSIFITDGQGRVCSYNALVKSDEQGVIFIHQPSTGSFIFTPANYCDQDEKITVHFLFAHGAQKAFNTFVKIFPPVKILFLDSAKHEIDIHHGPVHYGGMLTCSVRFDAPQLSCPFRSTRANYQVKFLTLTGDEVWGLMGWFDTGSSTRPVDLADLKKYGKVRAVISKTISTAMCPCGRCSIDWRLDLSGYNPEYVEFILDK